MAPLKRGDVMNLQLQKGMLTTNHPASSGRVPVYYLDGIAYGPADYIETDLVADLVVNMAVEAGLSAPQVAIVERFLTDHQFEPQLLKLKAAPVKGPGKPPTVGGEVSLPPVRVTADVNEALRDIAKANNVSLSEVIRRGVMLLLEKEK